MFLEILRALERLAAEIAFVRLQGHMHADVGGDVVAFDGGGSARAPLAGQVEVVGALATDMALADMVLGGVRQYGVVAMFCEGRGDRT